jgi:hypothetical protein
MMGSPLTTQVLMLLQQAEPPNPGGLTSDQKTQIALEALKQHGSSAAGILTLLVPFAFFALILGIFWLRFRRRQAQIQAQADLRKQLLDKFTSGRELSDFLQSAGGQRFLEELSSQDTGSKDRILRNVRLGVIFAALGLGMLVLSWTRRDLRREFDFFIPAVVFLAVGVGSMLSAAISHRLSQKWDQKQGLGPPAAPVS